jgi:hypothetical protein
MCGIKKLAAGATGEIEEEIEAGERAGPGLLLFVFKQYYAWFFMDFLCFLQSVRGQEVVRQPQRDALRPRGVR